MNDSVLPIVVPCDVNDSTNVPPTSVTQCAPSTVISTTSTNATKGKKEKIIYKILDIKNIIFGIMNPCANR